MGLWPCKKRKGEMSPPAAWGHSEEEASVSQEEGSHRNQGSWHLALGLPSLQNGEKINLLFKSLRLWYFVMAAQAG